MKGCSLCSISIVLGVYLEKNQGHAVGDCTCETSHSNGHKGELGVG